uniref:EF-hand domain-containing protein n=1 Tax=Alexandrium monilatum TaxID=311494 RepID=A0A7S4WJD9_9DINO
MTSLANETQRLLDSITTPFLMPKSKKQRRPGIPGVKLRPVARSGFSSPRGSSPRVLSPAEIVAQAPAASAEEEAEATPFLWPSPPAQPRTGLSQRPTARDRHTSGPPLPCLPSYESRNPWWAHTLNMDEMTVDRVIDAEEVDIEFGHADLMRQEPESLPQAWPSPPPVAKVHVVRLLENPALAGGLEPPTTRLVCSEDAEGPQLRVTPLLMQEGMRVVGGSAPVSAQPSRPVSREGSSRLAMPEGMRMFSLDRSPSAMSWQVSESLEEYLEVEAAREQIADEVACKYRNGLEQLKESQAAWRKRHDALVRRKQLVGLCGKSKEPVTGAPAEEGGDSLASTVAPSSGRLTEDTSSPSSSSGQPTPHAGRDRLHELVHPSSSVRRHVEAHAGTGQAVAGSAPSGAVAAPPTLPVAPAPAPPAVPASLAPAPPAAEASPLAMKRVPSIETKRHYSRRSSVASSGIHTDPSQEGSRGTAVQFESAGPSPEQLDGQSPKTRWSARGTMPGCRMVELASTLSGHLGATPCTNQRGSRVEGLGLHCSLRTAGASPAEAGGKDSDFMSTMAMARKHKLPLEEVRARREEFHSYNLSEDGMMSHGDFQDMIRRYCGIAPGAEIPPYLLRQYDFTESGVSFETFLLWQVLTAWLPERLVSDPEERRLRSIAKDSGMCIVDVERIKVNFDKFDLDRSGTIDEKEFRNMIISLMKVKNPADVSAKRLHRYWCEVDVDRSGAVRFEEFLQWYVNLFQDQWRQPKKSPPTGGAKGGTAAPP